MRIGDRLQGMVAMILARATPDPYRKLSGQAFHTRPFVQALALSLVRVVTAFKTIHPIRREEGKIPMHSMSAHPILGDLHKGRVLAEGRGDKHT